ncbi:MAG: hypothetical protein VW258_11655, partial [Thalassolituus sp.]
GVITGSAQVDGSFELIVDADGQQVAFTLTVSEILNNPPTVTIEADNIVRLGGGVDVSILTGDIDGDAVSYDYTLTADMNEVSVKLIGTDTLRIATSPTMSDGDSFELNVTATDSFGMQASASQTFTVERQAYQEGRMLKSGPSVASPSVVDTGDQCLVYKKSTVSDSLIGSNIINHYVKETGAWIAPLTTSVDASYVLDIEHSSGI